jgi:hypothetical protein
MPANKNGKIAEEELVKVILFVVMTIFVIVFISKFLAVSSTIPDWSRTLSAAEVTISNLDPKYISITRTLSVQLKSGYFIQGYSQSIGICPTNADLPNCICACSTPTCDNAMADSQKYCKSIKYAPASDFTIPSNDKPVTYTIGLVTTSGQPEIKLLGAKS